MCGTGAYPNFLDILLLLTALLLLRAPLHTSAAAVLLLCTCGIVQPAWGCCLMLLAEKKLGGVGSARRQNLP